jgi:hypothetical protein
MKLILVLAVLVVGILLGYMIADLNLQEYPVKVESTQGARLPPR